MSARLRPWTIVLLVAGQLAGASMTPLGGQLVPDSVRLAGRVLDALSGEGVADVRVTLGIPEGGDSATVWEGRTDATGSFVTPLLPWGRFLLRTEALGYGAAAETLALTGGREMEVSVELSPAPLELPPVVVVSRRRTRLESVGFFDRRRTGQGYSMTRAEIEDRRASRASDLFRAVPGVRLVRTRNGDALLQFRDCLAQVVLDGVPLQGTVSVDQILGVHDIEAIEVHSGTFFPTRLGVRACGTVMVWTREGSATEPGSGVTVGTVLTALALVALSALLLR